MASESSFSPPPPPSPASTASTTTTTTTTTASSSPQPCITNASSTPCTTSTSPSDSTTTPDTTPISPSNSTSTPTPDTPSTPDTTSTPDTPTPDTTTAAPDTSSSSTSNNDTTTSHSDPITSPSNSTSTSSPDITNNSTSTTSTPVSNSSTQSTTSTPSTPITSTTTSTTTTTTTTPNDTPRRAMTGGGDDDLGYQVELFVYDLSRGLAKTMSPALLGQQIEGIWHTGVVAYGREYFFGSGGIESCRPGGTILGEPDRVEELGESQVPYQLFLEYIFGLGEATYRPGAYDLFKHNCNNFSDEVSNFLCGRGIPKHILQLPHHFLNTPLGENLKAAVRELDIKSSGETRRVNFANFANNSLSAYIPAAAVAPRNHRGNSPDLDELNNAIAQVRLNTLRLEDRRNSLNEKVQRKEKKKREKKERKERKERKEKKKKAREAAAAAQRGAGEGEAGGGGGGEGEGGGSFSRKKRLSFADSPPEEYPPPSPPHDHSPSPPDLPHRRHHSLPPPLPRVPLQAPPQPNPQPQTPPISASAPEATQTDTADSGCPTPPKTETPPRTPESASMADQDSAPPQDASGGEINTPSTPPPSPTSSAPLSHPPPPGVVSTEAEVEREPPIVFREELNARAEFDGLVGSCGEVLSGEERAHLEELRQYVVEDEGSWALSENFSVLFTRVLHDPAVSDDARLHLLRIMAAAALKDDVILLLHQDRRDHTIMNYANKVEHLPPPHQEALALFFCNMFEHVSPSEWLLYISEWHDGTQHASNIRVTTKVAVNALLHADPKVQDLGSAIMYNLGTKEVKTVVFDDVAPELAMAILQFFSTHPPEDLLWRTMTALCRFCYSSTEVPALIKMIGPEPNTFKGASERVDALIEEIDAKLSRVRLF